MTCAGIQEEIMKRLLGMGAALALAGCATTANYDKVLQSWIGVDVDKLVASWGVPVASFPTQNGGKIIEYSRQRNVQLGGYTTTTPQTTYTTGTASAYGARGATYGAYSGTSTTYVQSTTPIQNIAMQCMTRFTIDERGRVAAWARQGNDCTAASAK